ncbi:MAG: hypothetical protein FJW20_23645, partial [Acidimicrobiia bacterium]|nr:hypothetical protein [Acidimicrobiia bacterium]
QIGDEIVAMDGVPAAELVRRFGKYAIAANPGSTSRSAAARLTSRNQSNMPSLTSLPENSSVEMRRANGENQFFDIPWLITGQPTTSFGRVFTPGPRTAQAQNNAWIQDNSLDPHQEHIREFLNASVDPSHSAILNFGGRSPIFALPQGFVQRFGRDQADFFFSGTFNASGLRIGFIRIPSFSPPNATLALQQFEQEMRFFEENTDGLIVDDMRNPGGSVAFIEGIAQRLHPSQFRILGFEIRATAGWVFSFISRLNTARATNQPQWVISLLEEALAQVRQANSEPGGRTGPISLNSTGGLELVPHPLAYSKPILCLVDEFSASAGDMLPAILQDNRRALLFGTRTMGAGGNVVNYNNAGPSEASFRVTQSLMHRREPVITPEYPAAPYVENIGVRPDILADYMTRENLMTNGSSFVEAFTAAIVAHIRASR